MGVIARLTQSGAIFAAHIFHAFTQWLVLSILAKIGPPEDIGRYSLALAATAPVILGLSCQHRIVIATDVRGAWYFSDYVTFRLVALAISICSTVLIQTVLSLEADIKAAIVAVLVAKAVESLSDLYDGLYQSVGQGRRQALSSIARSTLGIFAFYFSYRATSSLVVGIYAQASAWLLVLLAYNVPTGRFIGRSKTYSPLSLSRLERLTALLRATYPLAVVGLVTSMHPNVPRYVVAANLGLEALGIYSGLAYFSLIGSYLANAVAAAFADRFGAFSLLDSPSKFLRLTAAISGSSLAIGGVLCALSALGGPALLELLYNREFAAHSWLLVLLLAGSGFAYASSVLRVALTALNGNVSQSAIGVIGISLALVGSLALVPSIGLYGAAIALLVSHLGQCGMLLLALLARVRRHWRSQSGSVTSILES